MSVIFLAAGISYFKDISIVDKINNDIYRSKSNRVRMVLMAVVLMVMIRMVEVVVGERGLPVFKH